MSNSTQIHLRMKQAIEWLKSNKGLKQQDLAKMMGMACGISRPLHSHMARHTFATFALRQGVKIENLARMLGHTNITQTQRYAKVVAQSVHEEFDLLKAAIEKK